MLKRAADVVFFTALTLWSMLLLFFSIPIVIGALAGQTKISTGTAMFSASMALVVGWFLTGATYWVYTRWVRTKFESKPK